MQNSKHLQFFEWEKNSKAHRKITNLVVFTIDSLSFAMLKTLKQIIQFMNCLIEIKTWRILLETKFWFRLSAKLYFADHLEYFCRLQDFSLTNHTLVKVELFRTARIYIKSISICCCIKKLRLLLFIIIKFFWACSRNTLAMANRCRKSSWGGNTLPHYCGH